MQFVHTVRPVVALNEPGLHAVHTFIVVAPVTVPILPTRQAVHALTPAVPVHVPGRQDWQAELREAPVVAEYFPSVHGVHISVEAPVVARYFPTTQFAHTLTPVVPIHFPAGQSWQVEMLLAPPEFEYLPTLHDEHVSDVKPVPVKYLPVPQVEHALATDAPENLPAGHVRQTAEDDPPLDPE